MNNGNNDDLPSFEQFSKEIDDEMDAFAKYMMSRAVAGGPLSPKRYIIILASLSRGISMLEYLLEDEGINKTDIKLALMAMKATDYEIREELEQLKRDMR
jgi:hypothetical protein